MRLDPAIEQVGAPHGYWWVIHDDGRRTAWQEEIPLICPVCAGDPEKMPDCSECFGRGAVDHIPFAERPWDEVFPGLWLGGHDCQPSDEWPNGDCILDDQGFDVVISLYQRREFDFATGEAGPDPRFEPPQLGRQGQPVEHYRHRMADAELDAEHHTVIDELARIAYEAILEGQKVLVRCQAGLNRSSLITALALMHMGSSASAAIEHLRTVRSPYVLCNESFVNYLYEKEKNR